MSGQPSAASLIAAGLLDTARLGTIAPRRVPARPRRRLLRRLERRG